MKREISSKQEEQTRQELLEEISEAKDRYQRLVDGLSDIVFEHDPTGLTFLNTSWARLLGHEVRTSLGRPLREFVMDRDHELIDQWLARTVEDPGQSVKTELRLLRDNAEECWTEILGIFDPLQLKHRGTIRDITDVKSSQLKLVESERHFLELADSAPVMIWISGLDTLCHYFNKFWLDFTGRTLEQEIGNGWAEGVHPADFDACLETYLTAFHARQAFDMDYRLRRHDGEYRWIQDRGRPRFDSRGTFLGFIGSCVDVTERKQGEQYFRAVVEASPIAMVLVNDRGRVELVNQELAKLFGYELPELLGQSVEMLVPVPLRRQHEFDRRLFSQSPSQRQMGANRDVKGQRKDGSTFSADIGLSTVRLNDRVYAIAVVVDITERLRAEQEIHDLNVNLEQKVAIRTAALEEASSAKSKFLAHMSHEIRTPLNAVLGLAQLLDKESLDIGQQAMVRHIREAGELLLHIVNDILDLSKIEAGQFSLELLPFSLSQVIQNVMHIMDSMATAKGLVLRIPRQPDFSGDLVGDAMRLEQILLNLLSNAVKFTEHGEICLAVDLLETDGQNSRLRFEVSDTGIGMDAASQAKLFKPFSQADDSITRRFGGTGLGLSISKYLVEHMGGRMGLNSEPGQGSTFWFEIPFARPASPAVLNLEQDIAHHGTEAEPNPVVRFSDMRVLIVDDSAINRMVVQRALSKLGITTLEAINGQEALDMLRQENATIDMVLMDIQMPIMDGVTATKEIRRDTRLHLLPVIALTAGVLPEEREAALQAGVDDFLAKPVNLGHLRDILETAAGRVRRLN